MPKQQQIDFLKQRYKPLTLCFDHHSRLISWQGDLAHYGFKENILNAEAEELLPLLVGMDTQESTEIPYVNLSNGYAADIHIHPNDSGFAIFLVDSSRQRAGHEKIQQVANEVSLLNSKLEVLTAELEKKNTELNKANKAKSEFIAGMSHEFRTPIVSILGHSAWLIDKASESDQKNLETIERSGQYLLALIDNLLQQGKISAQQLHIKKSPTEISGFINTLVDIIQPLADDKGIAIHTSLPHGECNCYLIDKDHIQQVLINILANAIKFTPKGEVRLSVEYQNQHLIFEVIDTGIGIPAENLKEILIPFTRAVNASAFQGAGLGLSIANEIITAMGGSIEINSEVKKGSRVLIKIPAELTACVRADSKLSAQMFDSGPVLLMEDNPDIVSIYELFFREAGIDITSITDPNDFSSAVQKLQPGLIIIDYHLGETTGLVLVREIRSSGFLGKIIMLTATSGIDNQLQQEALAAGCNRFMEKPADVKSLVDFVKHKIV
jgi:signal transduction histidine kinase/CheY-like chemotaxis protein